MLRDQQEHLILYLFTERNQNVCVQKKPERVRLVSKGGCANCAATTQQLLAQRLICSKLLLEIRRLLEILRGKKCHRQLTSGSLTTVAIHKVSNVTFGYLVDFSIAQSLISIQLLQCLTLGLCLNVTIQVFFSYILFKSSKNPAYTPASIK